MTPADQEMVDGVAWSIAVAASKRNPDRALSKMVRQHRRSRPEFDQARFEDVDGKPPEETVRARLRALVSR